MRRNEIIMMAFADTMIVIIALTYIIQHLWR